MSISNLLAGADGCACGKKHVCPIDHVIIGAEALQELPRLCETYQSILFVADQNTYRVCGNEAEALLGERIASKVLFDSGDKPLIPNEDAILAIQQNVNEDTELLIGIGSGVINDLCKYVSFQAKLPYFIVATAPSMDGYASVGSALILKGMKVTLNAAPPKAIIADTGVLRAAPKEMLQAGYGDIIGKYSCLNDWKLSALIHGEYFCRAVYDLTYQTTERVKSLAAGIANREEKAVGALMEALVTVGIAMSYVGNSRPASGSEHHLSHYFEITGICNNEPYLAHGIDVVYSSVVTAGLREKIISGYPKAHTFDEEYWEQEIRRIYTISADEVIKLQRKLGWYTRDYFDTVQRKWEEIKAVLQEAPTESEVLEMIEPIGLNFKEFEALYENAKIEDGILYAKDLKDRYTVLWLYYDFFADMSRQ